MTVLACDLGGTRTKTGVVRDGRVLSQTAYPADSQSSLLPELAALKSAWLQQLRDLNLSIQDCVGIAVAFPSLIEGSSGRVLDHYGKYPDAPRFDFRAWARTQFGLPLAIENDARLALVGEWQHGAGRGCDNLAMITLGTGLGTAAVMQGRLLRGGHGQAGVLGGHLTVRYQGHPCACGNLGCAEAEASTASLRDVASRLPEWGHSSLRQCAILDYAAIFQHAQCGDACALKLREHSLAVWAALAVNLVHAYDPDLLIVGGGIMASADLILPAIRQHVHTHAHTPWGKVQVHAAQLGDAAALLAGDWLLRDQHACA
jgi:glucokinase